MSSKDECKKMQHILTVPAGAVVTVLGPYWRPSPHTIRERGTEGNRERQFHMKLPSMK